MKFILQNSNNHNHFSKRPGSWAAILVVATLVFATSVGTAYAGLFSFLGNMVTGTAVSAEVVPATTSENSQKVPLLQAAVNSDPNPSKPGDVIPVADNTLIPDIAASNTGDSGAINTQVSTYIVRQGDTYSGIAKMFGVSVNTVMWANDLTSKSILKPGQTLVILPISGITYTVKKGDTVQGIAKKYKADVGDILTYNDLESSASLISGQNIIIPNAEISVSVPTKMVFRDNPAHDTNGPSFPGYYMRPIAGGVETQGLHGYNAVDLADKAGTPVFASAAGTVIVSKVGGWNGGYGNFVIISHDNGTQTLYGHFSKNLVHVGEYVTQGETIGLMGATGHATGPHVHFEIRGAKNPF